MRRRDLIVGEFLATSFSTRISAQTKDRVRQLLLIGYAWSDRLTADAASLRWSVFLNELRHHGYVAGVNLAVSWCEGVEDWEPPRDEWAEVMDDIRRLSPDVIVTTSHGWARDLNAVIRTIPIGLRRKFGAGMRKRPTLRHRFRRQADRTALPVKAADCGYTSPVLSASCEPSRCRPRSSERMPST